MRAGNRTAVAVLLAFGAVSFAAAAEVPKSGTYSAHFGWVFKGDAQELGPNRTISSGTVSGVMFNDAGKGFIHKARVDCPIILDVKDGKSTASGTCVVTDADGDKLFVDWKCAGAMPACPGDEKFVGGTGKYAGITGDQKFQGNFIGTSGAGWSDWSGDYKIP